MNPAMDDSAKPSPKLWYPLDKADAENVLGNSALLVATIQDTKDRISQIENIFCKKLYPSFQSNSTSLRNIYSDAKKAAEDMWKEKEKDLLLQIEALQFEKHHILEENQNMKLTQSPNRVNELQEELKQKTQAIAEKRELELDLRKLLESKASMILQYEKRVKELEEENDLIQKKKRNLDLEAEELRWDLMKKSKEVDQGMELQSHLVQLVQSKASLILQKEQKLKDNEEKTTKLLAKLGGLEKEVQVLQKGLKEMTDQVEMGKEFQENMSKKIESQALEVVTNRQLVDNYEVENKQLRGQVRTLQDNVNGLQKELHKRTEEVEEGRNLRQQLLQQNDSNGPKMFKSKQEVEELEKEKNMLLVKLEGLEELVGKLNVNLREANNESAKYTELHGKLLQQIETRDSELLSEKKKMREVIDSYKKLKSQYNFLLTKSGLNSENMLPQTSTNDERRYSTDLNQNLLISPGTEKSVSDNSIHACRVTKENLCPDNLEDNKGVKLIQRSSSGLPCISSPAAAPKTTSNVKSSSLAGTKRPVSHWRNTRSHQNRSGPDPHDDFLDTPLENIRGNFKKATKEEIHQLPGPVPKDMNFDSSDDETQDLTANPGVTKQQLPPQVTETKGFKYVEPVRKKAERENLKGVECKQCKKFYDAVLPDTSGHDTSGNKQNLRCEHHDGVSRHRYRYAPPLTPEGFWNIGFESEM